VITETNNFPTVRAGSKQAILIDRLAKGATPGRTRRRPEALEREQRQERAVLDVAKVKCHGVRSATSDDGTQRYHLVLPKGIEVPLGYVEPAQVKMAANRG
jgi:hypothetical protein